jgi:serine phosphatase RsbU (regulator of sigma subunit)/HAMP domain-containing protein
MKLLETFHIRRNTIARDLTLGMVVVLGSVFCLTGLANWRYSNHRDGLALEEKATEIMDNLASVLVTPMWNLNTAELQKIVDIYRRHSDIVLDIKLVDESGERLVPTPPLKGEAVRERSRIIYHEQTPLGRVTVSFSDATMITKQQEVAVYSLIVFAILTLALALSISFLLKRFLTEPFQQLKSGLDIIAGGDYTHMLNSVRQEDINDITQKVNVMAAEIAKRESALEENRGKLEILNQAILDIFSCSNTDSLIRTAMFISHKVCNVDHGWFLGRTETSSLVEEDKDLTPSPLVCVRGHTFEATEKEVEPHIGQHDEKQTFTFHIKSRHREVGQMTLAFDEAPDKSVTSLLKSLMSLVTLAQTRQSFIRETAFISAELQVAETVQKSMLPDDSQMPKGAVVQYYYDPVLRVGGDWFSVIETSDHRYVYIILGDVTGHGLAQGLITTAMAGAIQIVESTIQNGVLMKPSDVVNQLSNVITRVAGKSNLRMTCVAGRLDMQEMKILLCNAGHTFPLMMRREEGDKVKVKSMAVNQQHMLGEDSAYAATTKYTDAEYDFEDSDYLVFYTDGLTEAVDKEGNAFNRKFVRHLNKSAGGKTAKKTLDDLMNLFESHTADVPVNDDICVVVIGKKSAEEASNAPAA